MLPMPTPAPTSVPGDVEARNLVFGPQPMYPPIAKAAHVSGDVVLRALIDTLGAVKSLQVLSGPELLNAAAQDAVSRWRYKPYLVNGQPVEVETTVTVSFTLDAS